MTFARSLIKWKGAQGGFMSVLSGGGAWRLQEEVPGKNTAKDPDDPAASRDPEDLGEQARSQVRGAASGHTSDGKTRLEAAVPAPGSQHGGRSGGQVGRERTPGREAAREAAGSAVGDTARQPDSSMELHTGQQRTRHWRWPETDFRWVELKMTMAQPERKRAEERGDPALRPHQEAAEKSTSWVVLSIRLGLGYLRGVPPS